MFEWSYPTYLPNPGGVYPLTSRIPTLAPTSRQAISSPNFAMDKTSNSIKALYAKGFGELGFKERAYLQEWIANCPECLGGESLDE